MIERNKHLVLVELDFLDELPDLLDDSRRLSNIREPRGKRLGASNGQGEGLRSCAILALVDAHLTFGSVSNVGRCAQCSTRRLSLTAFRA